MHSQHAGFYIGLYYGGTGFGIALSALLVPAALAAAQAHGAAHAWQWPWLALGIACLAATAIMALPAKAIGEAPRTLDTPRRFAWRDFSPSLAGYFMFGVGYIGYMTFVIALLKQQGMSATSITVFYTALGLAVVASSRIWARMLDRYKGGESLAILNGVLGVVTILPALTSFVPVVFLSGLVFGAVFLSVVASTTALVRHNLPQQSWTAGISADGPAGLERGLIASAIALFIGAALAARQKALAAGA
jgi:predicted MFS family arabinose efflux permease